jgi:hypothetical protein
VRFPESITLQAPTTNTKILPIPAIDNARDDPLSTTE